MSPYAQATGKINVTVKRSNGAIRHMMNPLRSARAPRLGYVDHGDDDVLANPLSRDFGSGWSCQVMVIQVK